VYDNRGNLVRKVSNASNPRVEWRYHWDGSGRLRKAVFQDTNANSTLKVVEYYYDVLGRRVAKSIDSNADGAPDAVTKYAYDGDDILYEFDASNALTARHTHGPGADDPLYTQSADGQYFYYHKDGMGSVREITDGEGKVVHRNEYDAFGNIVSVNGCPTAPEYPAAPGASCDAAFVPARDFYSTYAYTGRQWDAETALYHYRARYYDPHIGRFISEDPQWNPNLYAYVSNNPMKYTDPSGEIAHTMWYLLVFVPTVIMMVQLGTSLKAIQTAYKRMWNSFTGEGGSEFDIFDVTSKNGQRGSGHLFVFEDGKLKGYYAATSGQIKGVCENGGGPRIQDGTYISLGKVDSEKKTDGMRYPNQTYGDWVHISAPPGRSGIGYHFDQGNNGTCGCIGLSNEGESREFFGIVSKWNVGWTTDVITSDGILAKPAE
jgi:RHS repeat-associated protein